MNLLFLQHGDYREAFLRLRSGGAETYAGQRRTVEFVASLAASYAVAVVAFHTGTSYDETLVPSLRAIGVPADRSYRRDVVDPLLDSLAPDLIVLRAPHLQAIRWARRRRVHTLLSFADLFENRGAKAVLRNIQIRLALDRQVFPCVANHNLNASLSVAKALRYPKTRIIPRENSRIVPDPEPKAAPAGAPIEIFFAGILVEGKGVEDCLHAAARLEARGLDAQFSFAGKGDATAWKKRATELGVGERVRFLGLVPNDEVRTRMRAADMVVVPSRRSYREGLPKTLNEALAARTPLVISDHPSFASRLRDEEQCLIFRAGNPAALAERIERLAGDPALYARLSRNSAAALDSLYLGLEWTRLVSLFLGDPGDRTGWVRAHSLAALGY